MSSNREVYHAYANHMITRARFVGELLGEHAYINVYNILKPLVDAYHDNIFGLSEANTMIAGLETLEEWMNADAGKIREAELSMGIK